LLNNNYLLSSITNSWSVFCNFNFLRKCSLVL
jgi:hypothetical protein